MIRLLVVVMFAALVVGAQQSAPPAAPPLATIYRDSTSHHLTLVKPDGGKLDLDALANPPEPEWVPDPSAGHYDCPEGWTAYAKNEPDVFHPGGVFVPAIYITPRTDKKGHVLGTQPALPICIQDAPTDKKP